MKCLVIASIIYVLCNAVIITRRILSTVPELSNCPGSCKNLAIGLLCGKERAARPGDPAHGFPFCAPERRGRGGRSLGATLLLTF